MTKTNLTDQEAQAATDSIDRSPEPILYGGMDTCRMMAISPRKLWELTNRNEIESVKIGTARRYRKEAIVAYIDRQTQHAVAR